MIQLNVDQLIFTRLETSYSPACRAGYQTAYASSGLSRADIAEIENRVQCFSFDSRQQPERLQYFRLKEERVVISRSVPIFHKEIVGARSGAFVAHCVVLKSSEFALIKNDPFELIDHYTGFISDADDLVERYLRSKNVSNVIQLLPGPERNVGPSLSSSLIGEQARQLHQLGLLAPVLASKKQTVVFRETAEDATDAFRLIFRLLDDHRLKLLCSFSTHIDNCRVQPGQYWAVAATGRQPAGFIEFFIASGLAAMPPGEAKSGTSMYSEWLELALRTHPPNEVMQLAETAQHLERVILEGESIRSEPAVTIRAEVCREFLQLHRPVITDWLIRRLSIHFSQQLAAAVVPFLLDTMAGERLLSFATTELDRLSRTDAGNLLEQFLQQRLIFGPALQLSLRSWREIAIVGEQAGNQCLTFWAHSLATPWWQYLFKHRPLRKLLDDMDAETYQAALRLAGHGIPPIRFACATHLDALMSTLDFSTVSDSEFVRLISRFVELTERLPRIDRVLPRIYELPVSSVRRLLSNLMDMKRCDSRILDALRDRAAVIESPGWLGRLFDRLL